MDGWMDGWTDGRTDGLTMNGQMSRPQWRLTHLLPCFPRRWDPLLSASCTRLRYGRELQHKARVVMNIAHWRCLGPIRPDNMRKAGTWSPLWGKYLSDLMMVTVISNTILDEIEERRYPERPKHQRKLAN
jgi:hypothetical protein